MSNHDEAHPACWYAIHTHPNQETRAATNLLVGKVEIFNPRIKINRRNRYTLTPRYQIKPLFPSYIFGRFETRKMLHNVKFTRGVRDVVGFGGAPTPIGNELIQTIQSRIGRDGLVQRDETYQRGDLVQINGGPLDGLAGVFEWETSDTERVMILLRTINYQARVMVPKPMVEKLRQIDQSASGLSRQVGY